jgi:hypothetical protein
MLPGFLAFKTVQLGMWNGLLNRATSSFLTRGVGAEAFAGLLALLAEGPVMTATQHALGQEGASWRSDLLANYRMMLGLRAAGGAVSLLGRVPGAPQGIWRSVAHQVGTLGGLTLAQGGDLTWSQTFQTLGYFHLTASLTGGFWGGSLAAREAALRQAQLRPTAGTLPSWQEGMGAGSPRLAQATAGIIEPVGKHLPIEPSRPVWELNKVLAKGSEDRGGSSNELDQKGIQTLRKIKSMDIPTMGAQEQIRRWIEAQPIAINVAHIVVNPRTVATAAVKTIGLGRLIPGSDTNDVAQMRMLNEAFRKKLGWNEEEVRGRTFRMFFEANRESFLAAAVSLAKVDHDWEFGPRIVPVKFADGSFFPLVCAGTVRQIGDIVWAFGAFTGFPGETIVAPFSSHPPGAEVSPSPTPPAVSVVRPTHRPEAFAENALPIRSGAAGRGVRSAVEEELNRGRREAGLPSTDPKAKKG